MERDGVGRTPPEGQDAPSGPFRHTDRVAGAGEWPARVAAILNAASPARVALLGERAGSLLDGTAPAAGTVTVRFASIGECLHAAPERRQADAALLVPDTLVGLERTLGDACRLYPSRLLLFVDGANVPAPERLFAFGFRRLAAGAGGELHEYRLRDYKQPPEWLNARFWANPERFGTDPDDALDGADADALDETDADEADEFDESDVDDARDIGAGDPDGADGRRD